MKVKSFYLTILLLFICVTAAYAKEDPSKLPFGIVDLEKCVTESKHGQNEQKLVEENEKNMKTLLEDKEKEITAISAKLNDPEWLDSLSPEAEEELQKQYQTLTQEYGYYQNQLMQAVQQSSIRAMRTIIGHVKKATRTLSEEKKVPSFIIQKDACFGFPPSADVTPLVVEAMNKDFDHHSKTKDKEMQAITMKEKES